MKIALSAGLLLGLFQHAAAFPCTWNGAGSSYVYHEINTDSSCYTCNTSGGCNVDCIPCMDELSNELHQTTCCRCATKAQCEQVPPSDFNTDDGRTWQGCDLYAPDINIADAVEAASAPGMWFTSQAQLDAYLQATVSCTDDCVLEPACVKMVTYDCGNTKVDVYSQDRNYDSTTCVNANTESKSFYVRFDDEAPVVTVTLGDYLPKKSKKSTGPYADGRKYEDIPLTIAVTDTCDPNPEITITVFSDETSVSHTLENKPAAVLERKYSNTGVDGLLQGWGLTLDRYSYAKKACGHSLECHEADGRYYVVRVCAKDQAGLWSCDEKSVGVPLKPLELKKIDPMNQGKLFIVAEDAGFWQAAPNEIPFRNENTYLNVQPAWGKQRLCWSNYALDPTTMDPTDFNVLGDGYTNDECWIACGTTDGCIGYQINYNSGACILFSQWGSLYYAGTGMPEVYQGVNIYAMGDYNCPDKNVVNYYGDR